MTLQPFTAQHYQLLIDWIPNAEFALLWGGPRYHWPIDITQIEQYLAKEPVNAYLFVVDGQAVGYIELAQRAKQQITLCRILIADPNARGKGLGQRLIELAIDQAKHHFHAHTIELAVFNKNIAAKRCYEKLGFKTYQHVDDINFAGEPWPLVRMKMTP